MAIDTIVVYKSDGCLSCWIIDHGEEKKHPYLAIDGSKSGFVVSLESMNFLTNGNAIKLNQIQVNATNFTLINCGFNDNPHQELQVPC